MCVINRMIFLVSMKVHGRSFSSAYSNTLLTHSLSLPTHSFKTFHYLSYWPPYPLELLPSLSLYFFYLLPSSSPLFLTSHPPVLTYSTSLPPTFLSPFPSSLPFPHPPTLPTVLPPSLSLPPQGCHEHTTFSSSTNWRNLHKRIYKRELPDLSLISGKDIIFKAQRCGHTSQRILLGEKKSFAFSFIN